MEDPRNLIERSPDQQRLIARYTTVPDAAEALIVACDGKAIIAQDIGPEMTHRITISCDSMNHSDSIVEAFVALAKAVNDYP